MAVNFVQNADGTAVFRNEADGMNDMHIGGPAVPTVAAPRYATKRTMAIPLAAVDTAGGLFSWPSPSGYAIIVDRVTLDVKTVATGACTADVGTTAANGTTDSANLITGLDVHSATGVFDNITDKGASGKSKQKMAAGTWLTGSVASGASAGLVGFAYIDFYRAL